MTRTSLAAAMGTALLVVSLGAAPSMGQSPEASPAASSAVVVSPGASSAPTVTALPAATVTITCDALASTPQATAAVDVGVGSAVVVSLCSNPTTGFRWSDPVSSDPAIVSVGGWTYQAPTAKRPKLAGAAGVEELTLDGVAAGHAVVTASYDQPWDGGQKGASTLQLDITVRVPVAVSIDCAAFDSQAAKATASVDVPVGGAVVLTVCSNASTGYQWVAPTSSDPAVAVPGSWVYQAPTAADPPIAGAPGTQVLTIAADSVGTAIISASYARPWKHGKTKGSWTLELTVNVQ